MNALLIGRLAAQEMQWRTAIRGAFRILDLLAFRRWA